jgi:hypothetical protein
MSSTEIIMAAIFLGLLVLWVFGDQLGTRDAIDIFRDRLPRILRGLLANANYEIIKRSILPQAKIHPTVKERFALETIIDCASDKVGNYRPEEPKFYADVEYRDINRKGCCGRVRSKG